MGRRCVGRHGNQPLGEYTQRSWRPGRHLVPMASVPGNADKFGAVDQIPTHDQDAKPMAHNTRAVIDAVKPGTGRCHERC